LPITSLICVPTKAPSIGEWAEYKTHLTVSHSAEGIRARRRAHTNTAEGFSQSALKRGITGTYHHISRSTRRYLTPRVRFPLPFHHIKLRIGDDTERARLAIPWRGRQASHYRQPDRQANA